MKIKHDGWAMSNEWDGVIPWSFQRLRTEVVEWWDSMWDIKQCPTYAWRNFRKRGTYKIVKASVVEVRDED